MSPRSQLLNMCQDPVFYASSEMYPEMPWLERSPNFPAEASCMIIVHITRWKELILLFLPLVPFSYWVLCVSIYSFPLVRYSCPLLAGVLHALLCLEVMPDVSVERDVLHVHLLLHHPVLSLPHTLLLGM